jgi:hypothetical protein
VVPDISTGDRTRGLLSYLFGPGRHNEHTDPHIVAAFALPGITDPGRVAPQQHQDALSDLAHHLDQPVELRRRRTGKKVPRHVWHCPVRTAPGDRYLTDAEWAEVARRIVHATGIAPHGDTAGCRWIAVRHADDHIHILATSVREDGRRPRNKRDGQRAQAECRRIEAELGLRRLTSGDGTAPKTPTGAEVAKAERRGRGTTARHWLREHAYAAAAAARDEQEYFAVLTALGIHVRPRLGPDSGQTTGYSLAAPGDTDAKGEPVYYSGSALAPDLSLNRLRERLTPPATHPRHTTGTGPGNPRSRAWRHAEEELRTTHTLLDHDDNQDPATSGQHAQAQAAAFAELLHNTAATAPKRARTELHAAAAAFDRANRSALRAEHRSAYALRQAGKELLRAAGGRQDDAALASLLATALQVLIALAHWHQHHGHQQQAAAARQSLTHLRNAYRHTAHPVLTRLTDHTPGPGETQRLATAVETAIPAHAHRILTDPAWPALATTLAQAESAGTPPHHALTTAAGQRELDTADHPAEVLLWRLHTTTHQPHARTRAATSRTHQATTTKPQPSSTPTTAQRPNDTAHRGR